MSTLYAKWTHPHNTTNVKDESSTNAVQEIVLPLHRPHFCIFGAKGPVNTIDWYTGTDARRVFGEATFDRDSEYFANEQIFLNGVFANQGCFVTRLVDPEAKKASVVLELGINEGVAVPQYQRDDEGYYLEDEDGNYIPLLGEDGAQVTSIGVEVTATVRELNEDEIYTGCKKRVVSVGDDVTTFYPIAASQYDSPGSWGSRAGFKFYCRPSDQMSNLVESQDALVYGFAPVEKPYGSDTADPLTTIYEATYAQFVLKTGAYDSDTSRKVSANDTIFRLYTEADSTKNLLPFSVYFYEDNAKEICDIIASYQPDVEEINKDGEVHPYMVNICSFVDLNGNPYSNVIVNTTAGAVAMDDQHIHYLEGGTDGDLSRNKFEELYRSFLSFKTIPELQDYFHYPITHMYDVGYSVETKHAQLDIQSTLPNIKITSATQDASKDLYDLDASISAGTTLWERAVATPESELYGTQACRSEIFIQAGKLNDKNLNQIIPFTYWLLLKRAEFQNAAYFKGDLGPDPNNRVTEFREVNFIPFTKTQKEICWKNSLNYCEYGRMDRLFFAGTSSVYKNKTSLLADIWFTDAVCYTKYIIDWAWADTANASLPLSSLAQLVTTKIKDAVATAFGSKYTLTECSLYQTDEEALLGTTYHVKVVLVGNSPSYIWNSDIIVRRASSTSTSTTTNS